MLVQHKICIVDDSSDYQLLLRGILGICCPDCAVSCFDNGMIFLEELQEPSQLPKLILLDMRMPELDGYQTLLRLKADHVYKRIPVVMMSADAEASEIERCYEAGVNSFINKPIGWISLEEQVTILCKYWLHINHLPLEMNF